MTVLFRRIVAAYLQQSEPEAVRSRKGRRFVRRLFWSAGVNDVWAFDQHDKWRRFGPFLHVGVDPFPGRVQWLKIWWTNRNPRLVTSYYLEAARRNGGKQNPNNDIYQYSPPANVADNQEYH